MSAKHTPAERWKVFISISLDNCSYFLHKYFWGLFTAYLANVFSNWGKLALRLSLGSWVKCLLMHNDHFKGSRVLLRSGVKEHQHAEVVVDRHDSTGCDMVVFVQTRLDYQVADTYDY